MTVRKPSVEFSRPLPVGQIGPQELVREIRADAEERAALARRFGLLALDRLEARLSIQRVRGGPVIRLAGRFEAEVTQACVVTLQPVPSRPAEDFALLYTTAPERAASKEVWVDPEAEDPPEPVGPGGIDLGEAVAQQLALALDPYPRAEGAALERASWGPELSEEAAARSPFAMLGRRKPGD